MLEDVVATWNESNMLVKMFFRHAAGTKLVAATPSAGIEFTAVVGKRPPVKRRLMLSEAELLLLLNADMRRENALEVRLLSGTAVRSDELLHATWDQFDFEQDVWSVPATKTGPGIQIPITELMKSWLIELQGLAGGSNYVLPARAERRKIRHGSDAPINPNTIGAAIEFWLTEHKPEVRRFTTNDLRSTAKNHMRALGVSLEITEMCLNHKLPGGRHL